MAVPVEVVQIALRGKTHSLPILSITDRRPRTHAVKKWCLIRGIEKILFDVGETRSAGQMARVLADCSMENSILVADKAAVAAGTLLQDEFDAGTHDTIWIDVRTLS
jgi:hypothetical protein